MIEKQIISVPLETIDADPRPVDRGIMESMASAVGQLYPIIAIEKDDRWEVWDGHVRARCARELGWSHIDVLPASDELEAERMAHMVTLAANARAKNPLGEARAIHALGDNDVAMEVSGLSRAEIKARTRLLGLAPEYQELLEEGHLALSAAKKLCKLPPDGQRRAYKRAEQLMRSHNEKRRRADRTVPTVGEIDTGVRAVKGEMQPTIPDMANRLKKAPTDPDPIALAAQLRQVAESYPDDERSDLFDAADILEGGWD